jgi:hypothetical protein
MLAERAHACHSLGDQLAEHHVVRDSSLAQLLEHRFQLRTGISEVVDACDTLCLTSSWAGSSARWWVAPRRYRVSRPSSPPQRRPPSITCCTVGNGRTAGRRSESDGAAPLAPAPAGGVSRQRASIAGSSRHDVHGNNRSGLGEEANAHAVALYHVASMRPNCAPIVEPAINSRMQRLAL